MRLRRFGRFLSGAGGDDAYKEYTPEEREQWYEEERRRRNKEWWREEEARTKREEDIARGYWVVSDPLTPEEEEEWQDMKYNSDYYNIVEKTENEQTWTEYVFKDKEIEAKFDALEKKEKRPCCH